MQRSFFPTQVNSFVTNFHLMLYKENVVVYTHRAGKVKQGKFVLCDENYVKHANNGESCNPRRSLRLYFNVEVFCLVGRVMWLATPRTSGGTRNTECLTQFLQ